jgi:hypothetical protein
LFKAYWGKPLSQEEVDVWEESLGQQIKDIGPGEIGKALHWLSDDRNWKSRYPPTLRDLRMAICRLRKDARHDEAPPAADCALCYDGWIDWVRGEEFRGYAGTVLKIPCVCAKGRRWLEEYYDSSTWERFTEKARAAAAAFGVRRQQLEAEMRDPSTMLARKMARGWSKREPVSDEALREQHKARMQEMAERKAGFVDTEKDEVPF